QWNIFLSLTPAAPINALLVQQKLGLTRQPVGSKNPSHCVNIRVTKGLIRFHPQFKVELIDLPDLKRPDGSYRCQLITQKRHRYAPSIGALNNMSGAPPQLADNRPGRTA